MIAFITSILPILQVLTPVFVDAFIKMFWMPTVEVASTLPANPNAPNFNIYAKP